MTDIWKYESSVYFVYDIMYLFYPQHVIQFNFYPQVQINLDSRWIIFHKCHFVPKVILVLILLASLHSGYNELYVVGLTDGFHLEFHWSSDKFLRLNRSYRSTSIASCKSRTSGACHSCGLWRMLVLDFDWLQRMLTRVFGIFWQLYPKVSSTFFPGTR